MKLIIKNFYSFEILVASREKTLVRLNFSDKQSSVHVLNIVCGLGTRQMCLMS